MTGREVIVWYTGGCVDVKGQKVDVQYVGCRHRCGGCRITGAPVIRDRDCWLLGVTECMRVYVQVLKTLSCTVP